MAYNDLRDWIKQLDKSGELKRITAEVDPILEMAEIADRAAKLGRGTSKAGGPALLFENIKGHPGARVLMNQFGSERRMRLALETDSLDAIADRIRTLLKPQTPTSFMDKMKMLPMLAEIGNFFPKVIAAKDAPCKQVIHRGEDVNLLELPILKTWPHDGGRFITLPCVITRDPKSGKRNVGMYRMQVYDGKTTGMHWQRQKVAAEHMRDRLREASPDSAARVDLMALTAGGTTAASSTSTLNTTTVTRIREDRMEVAVAIGTDPATTFSAIVPAPPEVEEYLISGFLRQKPLELVKAETVDLEVPANAEYVLEGYVQLGELRTEGPFGDHTGFYTMQEDYPVFHITCITHRKDPIYAATIVGKPPMEDAWMGKAVERIFLPLMQLTLPEIVDVNLPAEGVFHNLMIVSIKKSYAGHARKIMNGIWAMGQAMFTKCIIVVDEDCDVQDLAEVTLRTTNNIDPERDIQFTLGPIDSLDHAVAATQLRQQDGHRRYAQVGRRRLHPPLARHADHGHRGQNKGRGPLEKARHRVTVGFAPQRRRNQLTACVASVIVTTSSGVFVVPPSCCG